MDERISPQYRDPEMDALYEAASRAGVPTQYGLRDPYDAMQSQPMSLYDKVIAMAKWMGGALPFRGGISQIGPNSFAIDNKWKSLFRGEPNSPVPESVPKQYWDTKNAGRWFSDDREIAEGYMRTYGGTPQGGRLLETKIPESVIASTDLRYVLLPLYLRHIARMIQKFPDE